MCTTCFAAAPLGRDRLGDRDRALERERVAEPELLAELALQRLVQALPRVDAAARQQPVLLAGLLLPAEQHAVLPAQQRGHANARLHQCRRAEAAHAALRLGQLSTSTGSTSGTGSTTSCAIRIPGSTTNVSRASVFSSVTRSSPR